jgi:hypothetical protein
MCGTLITGCVLVGIVRIRYKNCEHSDCSLPARTLSIAIHTALSILEPANFAFDRPLKFVCGFGHGDLDSRCLMAHRERLQTGQPGLEQTPFVVSFRFVTVCVTEMRLYTGNPITEPPYSPLYTGMDEAHDIFTSCDVVICIDLNLHESTLLATTILPTNRNLTTRLENVNLMNIRGPDHDVFFPNHAFATMAQIARPAGCHQSSRQDRRAVLRYGKYIP